MQKVLSFLFLPVAFSMGVELEDCFPVARLIGLKIFANEFVAYRKLGVMIQAQAISVSIAEQASDSQLT